MRNSALQTDKRFTPEIIAAIEEVVDAENMGALTKWNKITEILFKAKIAYKRVCKIREVFIHPKNRGGLGINPFNAHETLATVHEIGCDKDHLRKAAAFEMQAVGEARDAQIAFNMRQIEAAAGLLADATGEERLLSVSCSHFTAALRAVAAGCETPEERLKDPSGRLNVSQLCANDSALQDVIENGYEFTVIPWYAEVLFPDLPALAQGALNADHMTYSMANELQVMSQIASLSAADSKPNWKLIEEKIKSQSPPCKDYLPVLIEFVKNYSGGTDAPIFAFLDSWARSYGSNKKIGQTFFDAITRAAFPSSSTKFPLIRTAFLACNLVCPKSKMTDGFARLLVKSDVKALERKEKLMALVAAEDMLQEAWTTVHRNVSKGAVEKQNAYSICGRIASRTVLFLTKKQKDNGIENRQYKNLQEIREQFVKDCGNPSSSASASQACEEAVKEQPAEVQASLDEVSDPKWLAGQRGLTEGEYYTEKSSHVTFRLDRMEATSALFTEHTFAAKTATKEVQYADVKSQFVPFKGKLQARLPAFGEFVGGSQSFLQTELKRHAAYAALMAAADEFGPKEAEVISFFMNPYEARTVQSVKKGELKLMPLTDCTKIVKNSVTAKSLITGHGVQYYIDAPMKVKSMDKAEWRKDTIFAAYWWVKTTDDADAANMKYVNKTVEGYTFPTLENSHALKPKEKLQVFEAAKPVSKKARN